MNDSNQPDLFSKRPSIQSETTEGREKRRPLAVRMRPRCLAEVIGHEHILSEASLLPRLVKSDTFGSMLFYGPPGCGKTTLAEVIAQETGSKCIKINAVLSNVAEVRDILRVARYEPAERTVLFIDEIHRFNKAQQDLLLPDVEAGNVRLIGATTHNPGFYIIPPLLSRSHLFRLEPLPEEGVISLLSNALTDAERGLGAHRCSANEAVLRALARLCDGDMRRALNALETLVLSQALGSDITEEALSIFAQERRIRYDADEDEHYDTISAFIKSIRGSDPDASLYWLAKMLEGGEDPRYIARRLVILASEDIGLADSRALTLATSTFQACDFIGMPECQLNLSHCTLFLATCPKSNSATIAIGNARRAIKEGPLQPVPLWLRDGHNKVGKQLGHGKGYEYSHNASDGITSQDYMEQPLQLYDPKLNGAEAAIADRVAKIKAQKAMLKEQQDKEQ